MSYILDALRRADAERSRGAVPGLHAQNAPADAEPAARDHRPLVWAAGGAGAILVAVVAILVVAPWRPAAPAGPGAMPLAPAPELVHADRPGASMQPPGETPPARPGELAPAARPVEPPMAAQDMRAEARNAPPPANPANPALPGALADGRVAPPPPGVPPRLADRAAAGRVAVLAPRGTAAPLEPAAPAAKGATTAPNSPYAQANAAAAAANGPVEHYGPPAATPAPAGRSGAVAAYNDLSPAQRAELPRLAVGGAIYSDTPSARMVILNGQVFHEGDKPAADTVLEQIRLKSAVLNCRGQRYEITF